MGLRPQTHPALIGSDGMNMTTTDSKVETERAFTPHPTVSIILPTHTELAYIRDCLDSILGQDYDQIIEVLVVDGGSTDGTREVVAGAGPPVRLVDNPRVTAAGAMNIGLAEATGDVVVRMDAHALYAPDYVRRCVEVLLETGADNVGGLMRPLGVTSFGRAVAAATSTPLGVGPGAFHYADIRRDVDTVFLGCYWRSTLVDLGGYDDESIQWAAEDHELNLRLTGRGGRIVLDPSIRSIYFPRSTPGGLARQYRNYGIGKMSTLWKHRRLPTWRPLAPAALVLGSIFGLAVGKGPTRLAVPAAHATYCGWAALRAGRDPGVAPHRAFAAFEIMHWSYGFGVISGLWTIVTGQGFTSRPRGHR